MRQERADTPVLYASVSVSITHSEGSDANPLHNFPNRLFRCVGARNQARFSKPCNVDELLIFKGLKPVCLLLFS